MQVVLVWPQRLTTLLRWVTYCKTSGLKLALLLSALLLHLPCRTPLLI
jgi:hypothetical protein